MMRFSIEVSREEDGRWIAEVPELPGVIVYGGASEQAVAKAQGQGPRAPGRRRSAGAWRGGP